MLKLFLLKISALVDLATPAVTMVTASTVSYSIKTPLAAFFLLAIQQQKNTDASDYSAAKQRRQ